MTTISTHPGDKSHILQARQEYNYLLQLKDEFVELCSRENLSPKMLAGAELKVIEITEKLKQVDSIIYAVMFGESSEADTPCESLRWQVSKMMISGVKNGYWKLKQENIRLKKNVFSLRRSVKYYQEKSNKAV